MIEYHVVFKPKYNYDIFLEGFNLNIFINTSDMRDKGWMSFILCSFCLIFDLGGISNRCKE